MAKSPMSRSSPSVERVVAVLNFFADHPGQAFTLTDLIRSLHLSRATCHALLTSLTDAGYLFRSSDKTYVLGPVLATIGQRAHAHYSPLQVAQTEMRRLADTFDVVCSAVARDGSDIVVRERANSVSHLGNQLPRGTRLPLRLPFAAIFFAWSAPNVVERWIKQLDPPASPESLAAMDMATAFARENGFQIILHRTRPAEGQRDWPYVDVPDERPVTVSGLPEAGTEYPLAALSAPVFDDAGNVAFVLALQGFSGTLPGERILEAGAALKAACERVTGFMAGSPAT